MRGETPFTQTFVGAVLVAVVGGLIVYAYSENWRQDAPPPRPQTGHADEQSAAPQITAPATPATGEPVVQTVSVHADGSTTWRASADGVGIDWYPNGVVRRIFSRHSARVLSNDGASISTAQIVAEEKAKAAIVRFMNESVSSTRIVTQVSSDLGQATRLTRNGSASANRVDQRVLVTSFTEVTRSYASGELTGVTILERGFDPSRGEAWAAVGIDENSLRAARALREMTSGGER